VYNKSNMSDEIMLK